LNSIMRGFRQVGVLAIVLFVVILIVSGCSSGPRGLKTSQESRPLVETVDVFADEPYTVQEKRVVGENCIERKYSEMNDSRFRISMDETEWIDNPPVLGESNDVRRVVTIFNERDEIDAVYLDKVYVYNGTEIRRSKHPMMFLVDPKSSRKLYFVWHTQYDPLKDVQAAFTNNTEELGFTTRIMRMCVNETETVNVTKTKKVLVGTEEEVVGYDNYVKVELERH
jgi:hypothetical protein